MPPWTPCEAWEATTSGGSGTPAALVGHLRVPVTVDENAKIPDGMAIDDAGESGPERPRTL